MHKLNKSMKEKVMGLKSVYIEKGGSYKLVNEIPKFGINYNVGYIGFSNNNSKVAKLIKWGTKYDKKDKIEATHALIIINEHECVEALMGKGVVVSPLSKYFESDEFDIIIREPKEYNNIIANEIIKTAKDNVGAPYSAKAIFMSLGRGLFTGHIIDLITKDKLWDHLCVNRIGKQTFICSGLVAHCLQEAKSWAYNHSGVLQRNFSGINPIELLYENKIFKDFEKSKIEV